MKAWLADWLEAVKDWLLVLWLSLRELVDYLHEASAEHPPVSWLIHGLVALPIAYLGGRLFLLGVWAGLPEVWAAGLSASTSFYFWREWEQIAHRLRLYVKLAPVDHIMDVIAPILFVLGTWLA